MGTALAERRHESSRIRSPSGPTCPLDVISGCRGHVPHEHHLKLADIHAELKRRRATEHVHLSVQELLLQLGCRPVVQLGGMLLRPHRDRFSLSIEDPIVILSPQPGGIDRAERPLAPVGWADSADIVERKPSTAVAEVPLRIRLDQRRGDLPSFRIHQGADTLAVDVVLNEIPAEDRTSARG